MNGTDVLGDEPENTAGREGYPPPVVSLRLGEIRAFRIVDEEEEPALVVSDGETSVEFACGLSGMSAATVSGAQRLAEAVRDYASALEAGLGR